MRKLFTFALVSILSAAAFGKAYYISSSSGDDSNDGSQAAPLKTIAAAPNENSEIYLKRGDLKTAKYPRTAKAQCLS